MPFFVRTSLVLIFVDFCVNFFQRKTVSTQFFYVENSALATYQSNSAILASVNSYGGINSAAVYLQPELNTVTP